VLQLTGVQCSSAKMAVAAAVKLRPTPAAVMPTTATCVVGSDWNCSLYACLFFTLVLPSMLRAGKGWSRSEATAEVNRENNEEQREAQLDTRPPQQLRAVHTAPNPGPTHRTHLTPRSVSFRSRYSSTSL
jgi:hypothetical protein